MAKLIELMDSDDERVASVAANSVLDRAFGKPRERAPEDDKQQTRIDISRLSSVDKALLLRLFKSGAVRTIDEPAPTLAPADIKGAVREVPAEADKMPRRRGRSRHPKLALLRANRLEP